MIKDLLVSFRDNFKEKTRNPFLGTYLIVWFVRNWELIYTLFNFDNGCQLADKISFVKNYYNQNNFLNNLWTNVYWAFGLLTLTYILLNISRLIVNLSEKRLTPLIYKITDAKSIVLKTVYQRMVAERDDLQVRLDHERESKSRLEGRIKSLETLITESALIQSTNKEENSSNNKSESAKKTVPDNSSLFLQKLKDKNLLKDFITTSVMINQNEFINNDDKAKDYFIELGLITFAGTMHNFAKKYMLTPEGENVLNKYRLE